MADAHPGGADAPLTVRLSIPVTREFRAIGTALAAKFAQASGFSAEDATRLERDVARAADRAAGAAGDGANLDIELTRGGAGDLEISVRCGGGEPATVRLARSS